MSENMFGCLKQGRATGVCLVDRGQGYHETSYNAQDTLPQRIDYLAPRGNSARVEKGWIRRCHTTLISPWLDSCWHVLELGEARGQFLKPQND